MKKYIQLFTIVLMLATQLLLAQHNTTHILQETGSYHHQQDDDEEKGDDGQCQLCALSATFSKTIYATTDLSLPDVAVAAFETQKYRWGNSSATHAYAARGPPQAPL